MKVLYDSWVYRVKNEADRGKRYKARLIAMNFAFHYRTKQIQLQYHFVRSMVEEGKLNLVKIDGSRNLADMLTKVVDRQKLSLCLTSVNFK